MKKVLILYNKLFHYRIPIFNLLSKHYELTVVYSHITNDRNDYELNFNIKHVSTFKILKFTFHKQNIFKICQQFDIVIAYGDIKWINYSSLVFRDKDFKLLLWTIGVPSSYGRNYGEASKLHYFILDIFYNRADGVIFYSEVPIIQYKNRRGKNNNLFVANNTVYVEKIKFDPNKKTDLLFIGSLYLEKGLGVLLQSYYEAYNINKNIPKLTIIGGGNQYNALKKWITIHNLKHKIELVGPIYNNTVKSRYFEKALACISPTQAGLSVLESLGYGVPFITFEGSITGGEIFNITNEVNGLILETPKCLTNTILDITRNKELYVQMGKNAFSYYWKNRKPSDMVEGIINAIENI